jgi:hypothetical protein
MVSTVRKSQASVLAACARRKARHDECVRCGAGWRTGLEQHLAHRGCRNRDAETFELADDPLVSPVRVLPGESQDQLAERARERRSPRQPVRVCPPAGDELAVPAKQRLRLEREGRPGRPRKRAAQRRQQRPIPCVRRGLEGCRRRIASSWRRTRISNSFERRGRASSHTSANRFRTTRYRSDQSKHPSLDDGTSAEPTEPDAPERRRRVCEPYRLSERLHVVARPRT